MGGCFIVAGGRVCVSCGLVCVWVAYSVGCWWWCLLLRCDCLLGFVVFVYMCLVFALLVIMLGCCLLVVLRCGVVRLGFGCCVFVFNSCAVCLLVTLFAVVGLSFLRFEFVLFDCYGVFLIVLCCSILWICVRGEFCLCLFRVVGWVWLLFAGCGCWL